MQCVKTGMSRICRGIIVLAVCLLVNGHPLLAQVTRRVWMDELDIRRFSEGIPAILAKASGSGVPMRIQGTGYSRGVGVASTSVLTFLLNGNATAFSALVGVDDSGREDVPFRFYVIGDRKILFESREMRRGDVPEKVAVNLIGVQRLGLLVTVEPGITRAYSNWADAAFTMKGTHVPQTIPNTGKKIILTPPPGKIPRINSPAVFGATPGNPFLYTVAATGVRPVVFAARHLPAGLSIDQHTGIISGRVAARGHYAVTLSATNAYGQATKQLTIKIGDTIALTPPIGWNGWNSWARDIDQDKVLASAAALVKTGLAQHGWSYINIDDAWQGQRGGVGHALQPNEKFPAFKKMADSIHAMGLKLGVYSTPWITSYAGFAGGSSDLENGFFPDSVRDNKRAFRYIGKYRFEKEDALQMAQWGVDYLKYDWRIDVASAARMHQALRNCGRDIFYSISNSAPFSEVTNWSRLTNSWRTGPDIRDSWLSLYISAFTLSKWAPYSGPGHWNDPDMMVLGQVTMGSPLHATRLTPDEQYSHVSIFSLLAAPLLIGCPIDQLDAFTLSLLTNDEVIAINQDPAGIAARLVLEENGVQVWLKPLQNGVFAIGLFNTDDYAKTPQSYFRWGNEKDVACTLSLEKIGLKGRYRVRDVWRQKDTGISAGLVKARIRHHGVALLCLSPVTE